MKAISPIAVDMGAKNTGVYLNHFEQGEDPSGGDIEGKTIVIDSKNVTWSQVGRTQKRHQIRGNKRRKLAKRLLHLILTKGYGLTVEQKQLEFLMGLINRRGYNRIETTPEQDEVLSIKAVTDFFSPLIFKKQESNVSLLDALSSQVVIKSVEDKKDWQAKLEKLNKEFKECLQKADKDKDEASELSKAFTAIKNVIENQMDNYDTGHLHRKDYLENVREDVKNKLLEPLISNALTIEKLANLIGNISNLQLRILRKYFNDESMKKGDKWLPEKLQILFFRWVRSWHCKQENEKENKKALLSLTGNPILNVFSESDPKLSIPPYEDQNNRRPPKDLTLRLKPKGLDKNFPEWESITKSLVNNYCLPGTNPNVIEKIAIQKNLADNVRLQKIKSKPQDTKERQILADSLHRILDRTINLDPYKLRWNSGSSKTPEAADAKELLNKHSKNKANDIIDFAKKYYDEVEIAKQGLWSDSEQSLFFRCNTNPPHKGNIQHRLISYILGEDLNEEELNCFIEDCWNVKIGRSTIKGIAKKTEEERKKYGNRFNQLVKRQIWLSKQSERELDDENKHGVNGKYILEIHEKCLNAADKIAEYFKHNDNKKKIYANVFSMAQIYNILETDIGGFSNTDRWNTVENGWRSSKEDSDEKGELIANAVRLAADSIRPFDGLLDRIITRQAVEVAQLKIEQIKRLSIGADEAVFVPIFMEQNRFKFEQSLHDIKGLKNVKKKTRDRAQKGLESQETRWETKNERIKSISICPYTGENIGGLGEIDHIIPQSESKKSGNVVFNSEANLIYCSSKGNKDKSNERYYFAKLNSNYLQAVFKTKNANQIQQDIKGFIANLNTDDFAGFHNLDNKEQAYLRHALFMPELDNQTFPLLNTRYKTLVNGTQGYFGKQIRKLLQEKYPNIEVKTYQIPAYEVSQLRDVLGDFDKNFKKQKQQGAFSHVIDAGLVLAAALQSYKISAELKTTNTTEIFKNADGLLDTGQWLKDLLPIQADVQHIERRPKYRKNLSSTQIFKEGLYGERFIPILLNDEKIYYGFSLDNCIEIAPLKRPKNNSKDFDKKLQAAKEKQLAEQSKCYDLLKEFLYIGSNRRKNKKPVAGTLLDNKKYTHLSVDKTKALNHLQKCAREVCSATEVEQARELEKLRYSVEKKKIKTTLLTGQGSKTFIKSLDEVKLNINKNIRLPAKADWERLISYPIKDYFNTQTTLKECFGKNEQVEIDNPKLIGFWGKLAKESDFDIDYLEDNLLKKNEKGERAKQSGIIPKGVFNKKIKEDKNLAKLKDNELLTSSFGMAFKVKEGIIPQESWAQLFDDFFHTNKIKNHHKHQQVRKDYSLPVVSAPSGGFRIKRKNPLTGGAVYQVSGVEGFATKGYDPTLKQAVLIDELQHSKTIAQVGRQFQDLPDKVCYFDEWKQIDFRKDKDLKEKIHSLRYAIGTQDRFYIRVEMSFECFKNLDESIQNWKEIKSTISNAGKNDPWKFTNENFMTYFSSSLLGKPRSNLFVEKVSEDLVAFSYIVASSSAAMVTAYQKGAAVE